MAIGLSILTRATIFAPKKESLGGLGTRSSPITIRSFVSNFNKLSPASPFDFLIRSLKTWRTTFSLESKLTHSEKT